jgi:hypothetical protein
MKTVEVWLDETSEPLTFEAKSTYTKGPLFCVYCTDGKVVKFPIVRIFRIVEGYGTHGGNNLRL